MARGSSKNYYKRFYANIKSKQETEPHFLIQRKESESYTLIPGEVRSEKNPVYIESKEKSLGGMLVKVDVTQREFKGQQFDDLEIILRDHNMKEDYVIKVGFGTNMGRSILNSLLKLEDFSDMEISLYTNKDGYNSVSVRNKKEWAGFLIEYSEYKALVRSYEGKGGKTEYDWTKVDEFFKKQYQTVLVPNVLEYLKFADVEPIEGSAPQARQAKEESKSDTPDILGQVREERANNPIGKGAPQNIESECEPDNDLPF